MGNRYCLGAFFQVALIAICLIGIEVESLAEKLPQVISAGSDRQIKRWDATPKMAPMVGSHDSTVNVLALIPNSSGELLASGSSDGTLKLWNISSMSMKQVWQKETHSGEIFALTVSSDGKFLATGGKDSKIRIWNRSNGKMVLEQSPAHRDAIHALQFFAGWKTSRQRKYG